MNNSVRTDSYASILRSNLDKSQNGLSKTLQRMSSGLKITSAKDDASGAVISAKTKVELSGIKIANNNIQMATSMFNVAEDALTNAQNILTRLRDLSLMAADSSYDTETRKAIQDEADALTIELERIQENTTFNKVNLFNNQKDKIQIKSSNQQNNDGSNDANANNDINNNIDDDSGGGGSGGGSGGDSGGILNSVSPLSFNSPLNLNTPLNLNNTLNTSSTNLQNGDELMRSFGVINDENNGDEINTVSPKGLSSGIRLLGATPEPTGIVADNEVNDGVYITGAFDFAANETYNINIDGVIYEVTNRNATDATISYSKEIATGKVTFTSNYFTIKGLTDTDYDYIINGTYNYVYGGNNRNTFTPYDITWSRNNRFYGGSGDETYDIVGYGNYYYAYGGNDTFNILSDTKNYNYVYGGAGDDIFNHYTAYSSNYYYGEAGNDTFNIYNNYGNCYGGDGNDTFNLIKGNNGNLQGQNGDDSFTVAAGCSGAKINGGTGTNTLVNNGTNITAANVGDASNSYTIDFAKNEQKDVVISVGGQDITYTIKNRTNAQQMLIQIQNDNRVDFLGNNFTITGQKDVSHYVGLIYSSLYFYGGDLDDNVYMGSSSQIVDTGKGNDIITNNGSGNLAYMGEGNDKLYLKAGYVDTEMGEGDDEVIFINNTYYSYINLGDGNDVVRGENANGVVNNNKIYGGNAIFGGVGTDSFQLAGASANASTNYILDGFDTSKFQSFDIGASETKNLTIHTNSGDYTYSVQNRIAHEKTIHYYYDEVEDKITFAGEYVTIRGEADKQHNIDIYGSYNYFYGGDKNDEINVVAGYYNFIYGQGGNDTLYSYGDKEYGTRFYGDDGEDTIIMNGSSGYIYGGSGEDTIYVNGATCQACDGQEGNDSYYISKSVSSIDNYGDNVYYIDTNDITLSAGAGNDTFYITGNNNNIAGGGGDDYFIVSGTGNNIDGGTGTNYIVDNGEGNIKPNTDVDPNSGGLTFTYAGEQHSFSIDDKMYMVKNATETASSLSSNSVSYTYNQNTGEIFFIGNNLTITACDGMNHNIRVEGDNNTIVGGDYSDTIIVNKGTNNLVKGNQGNDNITLNSSNNAVQGGSGNDNVTINATTDKAIDLGEGNDTLNINANDNTNINLGSGNDIVRSTTGTSGNTIDLSNGNNDLLLNGSNNTITALNGNNRISAVGNENNISAGSGKNILGVNGASNTLEAKGNSTFNAQGSNNTFNLTGNQNIVNSQGNNATITSTGNSTINSKGANSSVSSLGNSTISVTGNDSLINSIGNSSITTKGENITLNSIGNSTINQTGDSATIEAQTGSVTLAGSNSTLNAKGVNLNIQGNNNEIENIIEDENYNPDNEVRVNINMEGNSNNLTTNNTSDNVTLKGNSNTLNLNNLNDKVEIEGNNNAVTYTEGTNSTKLRGDSNNIQGGLGSDSFKINSGKNNIVNGGEPNQKNTLYDLGENTDAMDCIDVTPRPLHVDIQVGYDAGEDITATLQFLLGDFWVDVSTVENANESIKRIDEVLDEISSQMSVIGAQLNRFSNMFELNHNTLVNLESKNSLITDCDIAKESAEFALNNIRQDMQLSLFAQSEGLRRNSLMNLIYGAAG